MRSSPFIVLVQLYYAFAQRPWRWHHSATEEDRP